jgi:A/G-specific adenine glycosylase
VAKRRDSDVSPADRSTGPATPRRAQSLRRRLLEWFGGARRPLPWRDGYDPYRVWISEMMLQQTQVETVLPYYERWMARFPTLASVAEAEEEEVLKAWEGMGYYARARSLHRAARRVVAEHGGRLPASLEALRALPGIGPYTAGAIASIAFNLPAPAVDGNVARVLARLFAVEEPVNAPAGRAEVERLAGALLGRKDARDFNQSLMELGALVCRPSSPACPLCPVRRGCAAHGAGNPEAYPRRRPRKERRMMRGVMALLERGGRVLVRKRSDGGMWGGLWEFPWLECGPGEAPDAALVRLLSELGAGPGGGAEKLGIVRHGLTHLQMELVCFRARADSAAWAAGEAFAPRPAGNGAGPRRWVTRAALARLPLARLNHKALRLWRPDAG